MRQTSCFTNRRFWRSLWIAFLGIVALASSLVTLVGPAGAKGARGLATRTFSLRRTSSADHADSLPRLRKIPTTWHSQLAQWTGMGPSRAHDGLSDALPVWRGWNGRYSYTMVGTNPNVPEGRRSVTDVTAEIVPVKVTFAVDGTTFDPTQSEPGCSAVASPLALTLSSPLFQPVTLDPGGTGLGVGQYPTSLFQRANFYKETSATGAVNPNYGIRLNDVTEAPIDIQVPVGVGAPEGTGCSQIGVVDFSSFMNDFTSLIFSSLAKDIPPSVLPIFLLSNVVFFHDTVGSCCTVGVSGLVPNPAFHSKLQPFLVGDFDTSGQFEDAQDVAALTGLVGSWLDDPYLKNRTPAWTVSSGGCANILYASGPLDGSTFPVSMPNGYTYHLDDLAFRSWFYGDRKSSAVNGWYSFNGTLMSPASPCDG
jgi:hypothetical protein